jgi:hypothetical protein
MLAAIGAFGAVGLWNAGRSARWLCLALLVWQLTSSAVTHPDYLPYFNELAISEEKFQPVPNVGKSIKLYGASGYLVACGARSRPPQWK